MSYSASKDSLLVPGPGMYQAPSDFGHLMPVLNKNFSRNRSTSKSITDFKAAAKTQENVTVQEP